MKKDSDNRLDILGKIEAYRGANKVEEEMRVRLTNFVLENPNCFEKSLQIGHVNGSAWIVDSSLQHTLLTHHAKLNKWLQLGGHSDGNPDTSLVAYREACEESGLSSIQSLSGDIFDIDIHLIPAKSSEPEHLHYDIRFVFVADKDEKLTISLESKDLQWIAIDQVQDFNPSNAMQRMIQKTKSLR